MCRRRTTPLPQPSSGKKTPRAGKERPDFRGSHGKDPKEMPEEWLRVLEALRQQKQTAYSSIMGGALRDLFNGRAVKDVDIFLPSQGSTRKNEKLIMKAFAKAGLAIRTKKLLHHRYSGASYCLEEKPALSAEAPFPTIRDLIEACKSTVRHGTSLPPTTRAEPARLQRRLRRRLCFYPAQGRRQAIQQNAVGNMPDGFRGDRPCAHLQFSNTQISASARSPRTASASMQATITSETSRKILRLNPLRQTSPERVLRLKKKYPDWSLCDTAQKRLPPEEQ